MKAQRLRVVIITQAALADVQTAFDKVRTQAITAMESGVADYPSIKDADLIQQPWVVWDGTKYTMFIFVTSG